MSLQAWLKIVELYGVTGYALAVRGVPVDDCSRWGVFRDVRVIDINLLPLPVLPVVEEVKEPDATDQLLGGLGAVTSLFGFGGSGTAATSSTAKAVKSK